MMGKKMAVSLPWFQNYLSEKKQNTKVILNKKPRCLKSMSKIGLFVKIDFKNLFYFISIMTYFNKIFTFMVIIIYLNTHFLFSSLPPVPHQLIWSPPTVLVSCSPPADLISTYCSCLLLPASWSDLSLLFLSPVPHLLIWSPPTVPVSLTHQLIWSPPTVPVSCSPPVDLISTCCSCLMFPTSWSDFHLLFLSPVPHQLIWSPPAVPVSCSPPVLLFQSH